MSSETLREAFSGETPFQGDSGLSRMLQALHDDVGAAASGAVVRDVRTNLLIPLDFIGHSDASRTDYLRHFHRIDPCHQRFVQRSFRPGVRFLSEIIPPRQFQRTEFFNEYWRAHRFGDAVGIFGRVESGLMFNVGFLKQDGAGEFSSNVRAILAEATPHLEQAIQAMRDSRLAMLRKQVRNPLVDHLPLSVFLVTAQMDLLECSEGAEELLARRNSFALKEGKLSHRDTSIDAHLRSRLRRLAAEFEPDERDRRPQELGADISSNHDCPQNVYILSVLADFRPCFLLIVTDLSHPADRGMIERTLISLFGLTPAEAEIAAAVFEGRSTNSIATGRGVKRETVRSQMKSVFEKTRCRSRVELIRKISALVIPFR
jgi:DNA-binding CsgD family transcriptional regulator